MKMPLALRLLPLLLITLLISACSEKDVAETQGPRPIRAMKVNDVSALQQRSFPGRASATQEVDGISRNRPSYRPPC